MRINGRVERRTYSRKAHFSSRKLVFHVVWVCSHGVQLTVQSQMNMCIHVCFPSGICQSAIEIRVTVHYWLCVFIDSV